MKSKTSKVEKPQTSNESEPIEENNISTLQKAYIVQSSTESIFVPPIKVSQPRVLSTEFLTLKAQTVAEIDNALKIAPVVIFSSITDRIGLLAKLKFSYLLCLLLTIILSATFSIGGSILTNEPRTILIGEIWVWPTVLICSLIYNRAILNLSYTLDRHCFDQISEQSLQEFRSIVQKWFSPKQKFLFNLTFSIILSAFLIFAFYLTTSTITYITYIAALLVTQFVAAWIHGASLVTLYTNFLSNPKTQIDIYPLNPAHSIIIKKSESLVQLVGFTIVIILAFFMPGPAVITGPNPYYLYIGIGILCGSAVVVLLIFADGHRKLTQVVQQQKNVIIDTIQNEIRQILRTQDITDKTIVERLEYLTKLHDMIFQTPDRTLFFGNAIRLLSSMLIPTSTFLFSNSRTIWSAIQSIF